MNHAHDRAQLGAGLVHRGGDRGGVAHVDGAVQDPAPGGLEPRQRASNLAVGEGPLAGLPEGSGAGPGVREGVGEQRTLDLRFGGRVSQVGGLGLGRRGSTQEQQRDAGPLGERRGAPSGHPSRAPGHNGGAARPVGGSLGGEVGANQVQQPAAVRGEAHFDGSAGVRQLTGEGRGGVRRGKVGIDVDGERAHLRPLLGGGLDEAEQAALDGVGPAGTAEAEAAVAGGDADQRSAAVPQACSEGADEGERLLEGLRRIGRRRGQHQRPAGSVGQASVGLRTVHEAPVEGRRDRLGQLGAVIDDPDVLERRGARPQRTCRAGAHVPALGTNRRNGRRFRGGCGSAGGGRGRSFVTGSAHELGDLPEGAQLAQFLRLDLRGVRHPLGEERQDLDPLDRVDPQVRFHVHVEVDHVLGVPGGLRHDRDQRGHHPGRRGRGRSGGGGGGDGRGRLIDVTAAHELRDLAQRAELAERLGLDLAHAGHAVGEQRQDLDPLDRVDPQVRLHVHVEVNHVDGVAGGL